MSKKLLYIAPVMPSNTGNGLAMRAGLFLHALARDFDVFLLVIPVSGKADENAIPSFVGDRVCQVAVQPTIRGDDPAAAMFSVVSRFKASVDPTEGAVDDLLKRVRAMKRLRPETGRLDDRPALAQHAREDTVREAAGRFPGVTFDIVHVMRLYMAPFAEPYLGALGPTRAVCVLDLDDDESKKYARLSALHLQNGSTALAESEARDSERFVTMEREYLPRFDSVIVCSQSDADHLRARHGLENLTVVPNAAHLPEMDPPARDAPRFDCLFVGSLEYYPNIDGTRFFCQDILPRLRSIGPGQASVAVVGRGAPAEFAKEIAELPGVTFVGEVGDLEPFYRASQVAVVPLRAGGGTRIKILEAFALGTPVVSTTMGAEGLDVRDGQHLLLSDSADAFASACSRLLGDPRLRQELATEASTLVRARYGLPVVTERVRAVYRRLSERPQTL